MNDKKKKPSGCKPPLDLSKGFDCGDGVFLFKDPERGFVVFDADNGSRFHYDGEDALSDALDRLTDSGRWHR